MKPLFNERKFRRIEQHADDARAVLSHATQRHRDCNYAVADERRVIADLEERMYPALPDPVRMERERAELARLEEEAALAAEAVERARTRYEPLAALVGNLRKAVEAWKTEAAAKEPPKPPRRPESLVPTPATTIVSSYISGIPNRSKPQIIN